jgi:hypothetical protein
VAHAATSLARPLSVARIFVIFPHPAVTRDVIARMSMRAASASSANDDL